MVNEMYSHQMVNEFLVRNFTDQELEQESLEILVNFIVSLDVCPSCLRAIPAMESAFGSGLDFKIDFESKTLDIKYRHKMVVSSW